MKTVVVGPRPAELEELVRRRHELGQDLFDEVWEGTYHMAPAPHSRRSRVPAELTRVMLALAQGMGCLGWTPSTSESQTTTVYPTTAGCTRCRTPCTCRRSP